MSGYPLENAERGLEQHSPSLAITKVEVKAGLINEDRHGSAVSVGFAV